jgi:hypothetical protein
MCWGGHHGCGGQVFSEPYYVHGSTFSTHHSSLERTTTARIGSGVCGQRPLRSAQYVSRRRVEVGRLSRLMLSAGSGHHTPSVFYLIYTDGGSRWGPAIPPVWRLTIYVFCQFAPVLSGCQGMRSLLVALSNS